ncbi:RagB/SusD family nutrient uptake outer membrane protein [Marinilongibacter aquaticus]|uniref:RagB/SusD family nutrient uptake outer membrane protein n=1 Tax=Marinilongibacter aquaticus TaxID=2975157 RepID=UPI0021BD9678|nr:RagB/SusD family nutrient uptake outer membrane protein [Marinilongibacter aquaticus]UBM57751.1 RagB/SusD family nutrient uptake outer membrane protein [Marinilongibacter aquaticus]
MKKYKNNLLKALAGGVILSLPLQSCTDLTEPVYDAIPADQFLLTDDQIKATVGPAYGGMRGLMDNWFNPSEVTSDELIVPTRGGDWYDGGNWLHYSRHTYGPLHTPINDVWGFIFGEISKVNQLIPVVGNSQAAVDELRTIRAFYYFMAIDMFGNVPIVTDANSVAETKSRAEVYAFIVKELTESIPSLPSEKVYARMNQDVGNMLLAKVYLNAEVYNGTAEWQKAYDTIDKVISAGNYSLTASTLDNFTTTNENSPEAIFNIPFDKSLAGGMNFQMRTLHYQNARTFDLGVSPWNGFCTMADFYNSFDSTDERKAMWLVGQQYSSDGEILLDANNNPLEFIADIPKDEMTSADPEYQIAGARSQKYQIQVGNQVSDQDNDFVFFRLADALLMKAEAGLHLGKTAEALDLVNTVRERSGIEALTSVDSDAILAERGRELAWEGWRRNDLIRFDKFTTPWKFMSNTDKNKELFPIPQPRIDANPLLQQNPGYTN